MGAVASPESYLGLSESVLWDYWADGAVLLPGAQA